MCYTQILLIATEQYIHTPYRGRYIIKMWQKISVTIFLCLGIKLINSYKRCQTARRMVSRKVVFSWTLLLNWFCAMQIAYLHGEFAPSKSQNTELSDTGMTIEFLRTTHRLPNK